MDEDGGPLWVVMDLCKILGRPRTQELMARVPDDDKRRVPDRLLGAKYSQVMLHAVNYHGLMVVKKIESRSIGKAFFSWMRTAHFPELVKLGFLMDEIVLPARTVVSLDPGLKALTLKFGKNHTRILRDKKGDPWWVAADVCAALGIEKVSQAVHRLSPGDYMHVVDLVEAGELPVSHGANVNSNLALLVNEPGLYGLILESRKPEARKFVHWLAHEVLPKLRETGTYTVPKTKHVQEVEPHLPVLSIDWDDPEHIAQLVHQCLDRIALINDQLKDSTPRLDASLFYGGVRPLLPNPVERALLLFTQQHQVGKRLQKSGYIGRLKESVAREMGLAPASIQRAAEFAGAFKRVQACSEVAAAKILSGYVSDALSGLHKTNVLDDAAIHRFADAVAQTSWHRAKITDLTRGMIR
ncbi:BRO-N domain-containing protein [Acidithiobacillus ferrivorans]|nr:BRO family protein [Acidithiobacillus ferrivorans]